MYHHIKIRISLCWTSLKIRTRICHIVTIKSENNWHQCDFDTIDVFWRIFPNRKRKFESYACISLIGESWKTHPEIFQKFQFFGVWHKRISGKFIHQFFVITYSVIVQCRGMCSTGFWKTRPYFAMHRIEKLENFIMKFRGG